MIYLRVCLTKLLKSLYPSIHIIGLSSCQTHYLTVNNCLYPCLVVELADQLESVCELVINRNPKRETHALHTLQQIQLLKDKVPYLFPSFADP
jgi:hypothetical protein